MHSGAEDIGRGVIDGAADGNGVETFRQIGWNRIGRSEGGAFRGTVTVDDPGLWQCLKCASNVGHRKGFAADEQLAQPIKMHRVGIDHGIEECGSEPGCIDRVALDAALQTLRRRQIFVVQHAHSAIEQRAPDFQRGSVETQRRCVQHARALIQAHEVCVHDKTQNGAVADLDSLGGSGGAGCVHDVGQRQGIAALRRNSGECLDKVVRLVQQQRRHRRIECVAMLRARHDDTGARIGQHECDPFRWIGRIQREIGGTGLEDAEKRDDTFDAAAECHAGRRARPNASRQQPVTERVGLFFEFTIVDCFRTLYQRWSGATTYHLLCEYTMHSQRRIGRSRRWIPCGKLFALFRARTGYIACKGVRVGDEDSSAVRQRREHGIGLIVSKQADRVA
ncbi:hypothetical protein GALL_481560 [mine drainage metagenome]|uniref:Uncharacterized protein n=1 Tax=mine drainage metagenome TaxID=410659 RepID=A0A1J5PR68_9ZZZZ